MKTQTSIPKARTAPPQQPTPPEPRRNHPAHEVALLALLLARAALDTWQEEYEDLDDDHDWHDCPDEDCDTCKGLRLSGRLSGMAQCLGWIFGDLESEAYPRPQAVKRVELLLRDGCDLDPERLAQAFIKLMSPADEPAAAEVPAIVPTVEEDGEQVKGTAAPLPVDVAFFYALWDLQLACERLELEHTDQSEREDRCACDLCAQADHLAYLLQPAINFFEGKGSSHCRDIYLDWRREHGIPFGTDLSPAEQVSGRWEWEAQGQAPIVVAEIDAADLVENEETEGDPDEGEEEAATFAKYKALRKENRNGNRPAGNPTHMPALRYIWCVMHDSGIRARYQSYEEALDALATNHGIPDEQAGERREDFWLASFPVRYFVSYPETPWDCLPTGT